MATQSSSLLFNDTFTVSSVDRDGKKFDRVSRIAARSENHEMDLTLDVSLLYTFFLFLVSYPVACCCHSFDYRSIPTSFRSLKTIPFRSPWLLHYYQKGRKKVQGVGEPELKVVWPTIGSMLCMAKCTSLTKILVIGCRSSLSPD